MIRNIFIAIIFYVLFSPIAYSQVPCCNELSSLYDNVRDGTISREEAVSKINKLIPEAREYFLTHEGEEVPNSEWIFPLRGYGTNAIGGTNGSGYITSGYDFFDGNRHGGHPAHDIFIHDRNQDCLDDNTNAPVDVLSMSSGIVVALSKEWDVNSELRGGKFIIIYDTYSNGLFYYAHNNTVNVNLGQIIKAGDKIAEVGRSGLNAYKKRSPTHLHISYFLVNDGNIKPDNIYQDLIYAKIID